MALLMTDDVCRCTITLGVSQLIWLSLRVHVFLHWLADHPRVGHHRFHSSLIQLFNSYRLEGDFSFRWSSEISSNFSSQSSSYLSSVYSEYNKNIRECLEIFKKNTGIFTYKIREHSTLALPFVS